MSKVYGLNGTLTGRMGNTVFAVNHGVQIARQYQPVVVNPQTAGQIESRAKLKLLSQLAAVMAPVIAIKRDGAVSPRNSFVRVNRPIVGYANEQASIAQADILLTDSVVGLSGFVAQRSESGLSVNFATSVAPNVDGVVYVVVKKTETESLMVVDSALEMESGLNRNFAHVFPTVAGDISVHAYGVTINSASLRMSFGNMTAPTAEDVAKVVVSSKFTASDMLLTETRGLFMDAETNSAATAGVSLFSVTVEPYDLNTGTARGGTVTGGGDFVKGTMVTVSQTPAEGYVFLGWKYVGSAAYVSSESTFTFELEGNTRIRAYYTEE